jgi:hypothetical protein
MREWCGCGAGIHALTYRRVLRWRGEHVCPPRQEQLQVPPTGATSQAELSYSAIDFSDRIGFTPNR